jgi:hypothetical protein
LASRTTGAAAMKHYEPEDDVTEILMRKLANIERGINAIKLGCTFILLIVFCHYLVDMGWFGSDLQRLARR